MATKCPICGNETLGSRHGEFRFEPPANIPGGVMIVPDADWLECSSCGDRILSNKLDRELDLLRYDRLGLLRPEAIRAVREKTGLSQEAMAFWLGVGEKTYTRWEAGKSYHNKSSDNLIRLFDQNPEVLARFEAQRKPERVAVIRGYFASLWEERGKHKVGMAAHDAEIDPASAERLRELLKALAAKTKTA